MIEYFIIAFFTLMVSAVNLKKRKLQLFMCFLPWAVLIAGRVDWTADYPSYDAMFDERHDWDWIKYLAAAAVTHFEPAFFALLKYLPSYRTVIIFQSVSYIGVLYWFFYKFIPPKTYPLAFTLWMFNPAFFESFAAMRSTFVIILFVCAVVQKIEGKFMLSVVLVAISGLFHNSGWMMLPFMFIPNEFLKKHIILSFIGIAMVLMVALISPSVYSNFLLSIMEDSEDMDYSHYIESQSYGLGYYMFTMMRIVIIGYLIYAIKKFPVPKQYVFFTTIAIAFYVMNSIPGIGLTYRINCYLNPLSIAAICYIVFYVKHNNIGFLKSISKVIVFIIIFQMLANFTSFFNHPNYSECFEIYKSAFF